tara:strand:- start:472 stop:777 length:306 start_codon:yes stop_codon:yes gene_type:complete
MGYNMKRGNSAVPFKTLGSSPAKGKDIGKKLQKKYKGKKQTTDVEGKKIHGDKKYYVHKYTQKGDPTKDWKGHGSGRGELKKGYPKDIPATQEERSKIVNR